MRPNSCNQKFHENIFIDDKDKTKQRKLARLTVTTENVVPTDNQEIYFLMIL